MLPTTQNNAHLTLSPLNNDHKSFHAHLLCCSGIAACNNFCQVKEHVHKILWNAWQALQVFCGHISIQCQTAQWCCLKLNEELVTPTPASRQLCSLWQGAVGNNGNGNENQNIVAHGNNLRAQDYITGLLSVDEKLLNPS